VRLLRALKRAWLHENCFGERSIGWVVWAPLILAAWAVGAFFLFGYALLAWSLVTALV
jgi:hypothetical protein